MKCPKCNLELPENSSKCSSCGEDISAGIEKTVVTEQENKEVETVSEVQGEKTGEGKEVEETVESSVSADPFLGKEEPVSQRAVPVLEPVANKNKMIYITGGIVAAAIAAFGAFAAIGPGAKAVNPKTAVIDAFESLYKSGQKNPAEEVFGLNELIDNISKSNNETELNVKIESIFSPELSGIEGSGISVKGRHDVKANKADVTLGVQYAGMDLANMVVYSDDTNIAIALPELSKTVFELDYVNDLEGQIQSSPFIGKQISESYDIEAYTAYLEYITDTSNKGDVLDLQGLWKRYKDSSKAIKQLKEDMVVEKTDKKEFTMNSKNVTCQGYDVVIKKETAVAFLKNSSDFVMEDEAFKKNYLEYLSNIMKFYDSMNYNYGYDMPSEDSWQEIHESMDEAIKELETSISDVHMVVYVAPNGDMAALSMDTIIVDSTDESEEPNSANIQLETTFEGGAYLTHNMNAILTISSEEDSFVVSFDKSGVYDEKTLSSSIKVSIASAAGGYESDDADVVEIAYNGSYDRSSGNYQVKGTIGDESEELLSVSSEGLIRNIEKGKSIEIVIDSLTFSMSDIQYADLSGSCSLKPLESEITAPTGDSMDILASTEEEWEAAVTEISNAIFTKLFGGMSFN